MNEYYAILSVYFLIEQWNIFMISVILNYEPGEKFNKLIRFVDLW